jgi:hypothetical protein
VLLFVLFVLHLEPVEESLKAFESVANEPFDLKHHPVYIGLALQMQHAREMAAGAAVSDGKRSTSNRSQFINLLVVH